MYLIASYLHVVRSCSGLISQNIFIVQPQMFVVISSSDCMHVSTRLEVVLGKVSINEIESLGV